MLVWKLETEFQAHARSQTEFGNEKNANRLTGKLKMNIHEELFVHRLIVRKKRERFLSLLQNSKGRRKFLACFDHHVDIDMRYAVLIRPDQQNSDAIFNILTQKGAPGLCHVMSSNITIDNEDLPLREALTKTVGIGMGTLLSCIPGKLAYFEFEDVGERYILER